jgi:hypothetical protein
MEKGTSYFGVRNLAHAERDLDRFADAGLSAVLHTYSERDQKFYTGTMTDVVAASHDRGFTVYVNPWGVGRVFGGEALSEFVGRYPDARQVLSTGDSTHAACFNHPRFREFVREWTRDAAGLGADVLFWDEPHWFLPGWYDGYPDDAWSCRCEHCRSQFGSAFDEPMPTEETEAVTTFREESLLDFLEEMMAVAREEGAENAVCLLPSEDGGHGLRNWAQLAEIDHLDVLATDPYWSAFGTDDSPGEFVGTFTDRVVALADDHDLDSQIWIQGFGLDGTDETVEAVRTATRTAIAGGVDSVFMWGYDGCASISHIASERPEAVWNAYLEELSRA